MWPCASYVMRPLTLVLKEVGPVGLHRQRPMADGALCLSTLKHNGKYGIGFSRLYVLATPLRKNPFDEKYTLN